MADKDGDTPMHEALRHHTLHQIRQLQDIRDVGKLLMGLSLSAMGSLHGAEARSAASIACFLAGYGADLLQRNKKGQTPLDLCPDPNLCQLLLRCHRPDPRQPNTSGTVTSTKEEVQQQICSPRTPTTPTGTPVAPQSPGGSSVDLIDLTSEFGDTPFEFRTSFSPSGTPNNAPQSQTLPSTVPPLSTLSSSPVMEPVPTPVDPLCVLCGEEERGVVFSPCGHVAICVQCAGVSRCLRCPLCRAQVTAKEKIEECLVCSDRRAAVLFQPCLHCIACAECAALMKKCVRCRVPIQRVLALDLYMPPAPSILVQGAISTASVPTQSQESSSRKKTAPESNTVMNNGMVDTSNRDLKKLEHQLRTLKEQTCCPVCMDRVKNMAFPCGHCTCQCCGDRMESCPICRIPISHRILLY